MYQTHLVSPVISPRARHVHSPQVSPRSPPTTDPLPSSIDLNRRSSRATGDRVPSWHLLPRQAALSSTVRLECSLLPTSTTPVKATHRSVAPLIILSGLLPTRPLPTRAPLPSYKRPVDRLLMTRTAVAMKSRQRKSPGEESLGQALRDLRTDPGSTHQSEPILPAC